MIDQNKTKEELLKELQELKQEHKTLKATSRTNSHEHKQVKQALQISQNRLNEAHKLAHIGVWDWDANLDKVIWSKELYQIAGIDSNLPAPSYAEHSNLYSPQSWKLLKKAVENTLKTGELYQLKLDLIRSDGKLRNVNAFGGAKFDNIGQITGLFGTLQDITETKKAEETLKTNRDFIKNLTNSLWDIVISVKMPERIIDWSNNSVRSIGYEPEECIGETTAFLYKNEVDYLDFGKRLQKSFKEGCDVFKTEQLFKRKNGKTFLADITVTYNKQDGIIVSTTNIIRDITERKEVEKALIKSEKKFKAITEISPLSIYMFTGIDQKTNYINPTFTKLFGYQLEDVPTVEKWWTIAYPDEAYRNKISEEWQVKVKCAIDTKYEIEPMETVVTCKDGSKKNIVWGFVSIDVYNWAFGQDITEKYFSEKQIKESEEKYRKLVEHMNSGVAIYQPINNGKDFKFIDFNKAAEKITNTTANNTIGNTLLSKFPNMGKSPLFLALQKVFNSDKDLHIPPFFYKDNQREGWRENYIYKLPSGEIVAIFDDVTKRKNAEINLQNQNNELSLAKEKAEKSDRIKTAFLQNMSHEIRTPMNSVMGFASLLPDEKDKNSIINYSSIIYKNAEQLVHVIDDIMLYSQLQNKEFTLASKKFDATKLINEIKLSFNLPEYQQSVELVSEPSKNEAIIINSDYEKLRQVYTNLIANAYKYTQKGTISFGITMQKGEPLFFVKDTGIGIPKKETNQIFDRFYRASNVNKNAINGTGLGLSIVKELIELLGGKIWVESEVGIGSNFYFTLAVE